MFHSHSQIYFLETYPNHDHDLPNPNPYTNFSLNLTFLNFKPKNFMIDLMGTCPHKGGKSPQFDCVNRLMSPKHE